jgi:hypothetical protein
MTIPIKKALVCKYCPGGTGIIWDPKNAFRTPNGDLKCRKCVEEDNLKMNMRALGRNHPMIKDFLMKEQKKVDEWNSYANQWNNINKRMGGTITILTLKKNPYLG